MADLLLPRPDGAIVNLTDAWANAGTRALTGPDRAAARELRERIRSEVSRLLGERELITPDPADEERIREVIRGHVASYQRQALTRGERALHDPAAVERYLFDGLLRLGILQPFMEDPEVEEILVNSPSRTYLIRQGRKVFAQDVIFESDEEVRSLVKRLIGSLGRRLDESSPMVDVRLPDGSRLNAVIPPAANRYCTVSIRKFRLRASSLDQLVELGTLPESAARFLDAAVQAGVNVLVSGPTGAGKCVTGDTLVALADGGLIPIRELAESSLGEARSSASSGSWVSAPACQDVLTCDFAHKQIRPAPNVLVWRHQAPEMLFEVETRTGKRARVTPEHPFFTVVGGEITQVRADELVAGQYLAVASEVPASGSLPSLLVLLRNPTALYVDGASDLVARALERLRSSEGLTTLKATFAVLGLPWSTGRHWRSANAIPLSTLIEICARAGVRLDQGSTIRLKSKTGSRVVELPLSLPVELSRLAGLLVGDGHIHKASVELTSGSPAVRAAFASVCESLFATAPKPRSAYQDRCPTLVLSHSVATELLVHAYGIPRGAKSSVVRAPRWLFSAPVAHIAAYLSGLLDTDGSVVRPSSERAGVVEFCTTSAGLAEDIEALLLRLGVRSHRAVRRRCWFVRVYDHRGIARLRETLTVTHPERRDALESFAPAGSYSAVDVIPGLEEPLREARLAAGLSYAEVARIYGVSSWLPAMYERGERHPTRARALELAERTSDPGFAARLRAIGTQPVYWDKVVAVRKLPNHGETYVYDLTVPETHTFLIGSGALVSHNTTMLNVLGASIASAEERVITIEETSELQLDRFLPDCVGLQARAGNVEGAGEVSIRDLVRNALRMRPSRIVVGEVRGAEALDMLLAMNTGHDGSLTTIHGSSPRDALDRLATLALMAPERISGEALNRMIARTIELVLQVRFEPRTGRRRLTHVFEVTGLEGDVVSGNDLWALDPRTDRLGWTGIQPRCLAKIAARGVVYGLPPGGAREDM